MNRCKVTLIGFVCFSSQWILKYIRIAVVLLFPYQPDDHSGHERPEPAAVVNSKSNANMAFARFNKQPLEASPSLSSPSPLSSSNMASDSGRLLDPKLSDDGELFLAVQDSSRGDLVTDRLIDF